MPNPVRRIVKYFNRQELLSLVTSNFFSILYYNSDIWHLPSLKPTLKQKLLSASAKALWTCIKNYDVFMSFENAHIMCNRATPNQIMKYKLALCLYRLYNSDFNSMEFCLLNQNQVTTSLQTKFLTIKSNRFRIGLNSLMNRLHHINGIIPFECFNLSYDLFKVL